MRKNCLGYLNLCEYQNSSGVFFTPDAGVSMLRNIHWLMKSTNGGDDWENISTLEYIITFGVHLKPN